MRDSFLAVAPVYAMLLIRHPDPKIPPFEFNSSLAKLGVREKLAAIPP